MAADLAGSGWNILDAECLRRKKLQLVMRRHNVYKRKKQIGVASSRAQRRRVSRSIETFLSFHSIFFDFSFFFLCILFFYLLPFQRLVLKKPVNPTPRRRLR